MAGFFQVTPPVAVIVPPTAGAWVDLDLSAIIPAGANGVIGQFWHADAGATGYGFRAKGSGDDRAARASGHILAGVLVGCDAGRVIQCCTESALNQTLWVIGYTKLPNVVLLTDCVEISPGAIGAWTAVDLSVACPGAVGIIGEIYIDDVGFQAVGVRMNGSSDNRIESSYGHNTHDFVIGCDSAQKIQIYRGHANMHIYLRGYITSVATFYQNAPEHTPTGAGAWEGLELGEGRKVAGFRTAPENFWLSGYAENQIAFFEMSGPGAESGIKRPDDAVIGVGFPSAHPWFFSQILMSGIGKCVCEPKGRI